MSVMQKVAGGTVPFCKTRLQLSRSSRIFLGGNILALHMDVTPQNDCTAAVPKQMYFKNSVMGNGYETLVPFLLLLLLNGEDWSWLF